MNTITLTRNGASKTIPEGFSATTFLFGSIPSMMRRHTDFAIACFMADVAAVYATVFFFEGGDLGLSFIVFRLFMAYKRNAALLLSMLADGWQKEKPKQGFVEMKGRFAANDEECYYD